MQYVQILYGINKLDVDNLLCYKYTTTFLTLKKEALAASIFEMAEEIIVPCPIQIALAEASHWQAAAVIICSYEML